ncbi:WD repeat-containing protein 70, partial [Phenoliferia sp. Uapishka_3]
MDENGLPMAFGKVAKSKVDASRIASTKRAEPEPIQSALPSASEVELEKPRRAPISEDEDDEDDDDEDDGADWVEQKEGADLPVTHEIVMKDHAKVRWASTKASAHVVADSKRIKQTQTVSALSLDPSGGRVASGSYDYEIKLWDFGGMNSSFKPFRSWECNEGHQVHDVQFSVRGDALLAATGSNQAKLFDRDGVETCVFAKGDMYIRDLRNTDGHVAALTSVAWHPKNYSLFLSASADSTIRLWDVANKRKSKSVIVVKSKDRGGKTKVSACAWTGDGKTIGAACEDGTIHLWSASSNFARPNASVEGAHQKGTITSSIVFTGDGRQLASRGGDGTVKLWDTRSLKKPLCTAIDLPSLNPEANLVFSPDEKFILTGTAGAHAGVLAGAAEEEKAKELEKNGGVGGKVVVLRKEGLGVVRSLNISPFSVVKVLWHPTINQIVTGSSDGSIRVLYSPLTSLKGATLAVTKAPRERAPDDFASSTSLDRPIITPHSLPMFKDDYGDPSAGGRGGKRKRERERHDPQKTMKPMPPVVGQGKGGRIGAAATQHVVQGLVRDDLRTQDPREALLKYATQSVEDNEWTSAWTKTQPKPVFDLRQDPEEEEKEKRK